ncbi:hypothetical protein [Acrocarpospora sp. B8E8]|uniref:hypothetical protein n=1 Tax=Acrocarpospora sp. B8E8 TaxID=3153572 RepID=UPI00325D8FC6
MSEQTAASNVAEDAPVPVKATVTKAALAKKVSPSSRTVPKWETDARDRVRAAIRRYSKPLADLVARDANEAETRLLITDLLCDGLGYDKYEELTMEYQVKGDFADYGIRIDKQLVAFIEVKRCTQRLGIKHLRQVQMYAVNEGVEWLILTNGQVWQVYHLTGGLPVLVDLALEVDLLGEDSLAVKTDGLFYLSKDAFKRRLIDSLWKARAATSPKSLAQVILSDSMLESIRLEIRRQTSHNADTKDLARILRDEVIRPEALA